MSQNTISSSLLNVVLVLAESAITLVLRLDPNLRKAVYPLAQKNTVLSIRSYLPHIKVYATFTNKGILLDSGLPENVTEPDVVLNAYSHQIINSLISNDFSNVNKLAFRGDAETVSEVRLVFVQLGIASLVQSIIRTLKGNSKAQPSKAKSDKPDYKERIEQQQQKINTLSKRNRELEVSLKGAQSKQKTTFIAFIVSAIIAVISVIGWVS